MAGTRPYTDDEIVLMLNSFSSLRDRCLFLLGIKTGFRISELLSIKVVDVLQYGEVKSSVTVAKCNTKGKVASRCIPLSKDVQNVLKTYIDTLDCNEYLFQSRNGNKLSRVQAWRVIKGAAADNKLSGKVATHSSRKSFCERVYDKLDKDIVKTQKAMGHKSINSTVSYLSFNQEEIDRAILDI